MSRFAKLVNARAAREQEPPRQPEETKPTSLPAKEESEPLNDTKFTPVATPAITPVRAPVATPAITPVATPVMTGVATPVDNDAADTQREPPRTSPLYLDATHTASEQRVYSVMYRETISRGVKERHFGPKELCEKSGIRSDRTIRTALDGLIEKLSVEIISNSVGSPLGPRYRVFDPKEIVGRRKTVNMEIDTQSKKITTPVATGVATPVATPDKNYRGTPAKSTGVTGVDFAGVYNKYINNSLNENFDDDEAFGPLLAGLRRAVQEVTGSASPATDAERWGELAELLVTELKIAAGRTGSVSSVPAFLTEHLRRRHAQGRVRPDVGRQARTWDVSGPHFGGWEIYHLKGSPVDPNRSTRRSQRLVRPDDPALERRRQDVGAGRQQVRLRRRPRHAPVVRRHAAPVGVQARLASRAVADRSGHGLRRRRGRRLFRSTDGGQTWHELPGLRGHGSGPQVAAGRRRHVPAHDPARPERTPSGSSSPSRPPARSAPTTAARRGSRSTAACSRSTSPTRRRGRPLRPPHRDAPSRRNVLFMQKHWDVMRSDDAGESWREVSGNLPTDFGFPIDVHAHEPETIYVVPIKSDSEHYPPEGKLRVYRSRPAATSGRRSRRACRRATATSTCCATRWPSIRSTVRRLLRHDRRPGVRVADAGDTGRRSSAICRRCCRSRCRRCHDPRRAPAHLRTLARVDGEVSSTSRGR
jgi:hypothetical protein